MHKDYVKLGTINQGKLIFTCSSQLLKRMGNEN